MTVKIFGYTLVHSETLKNFVSYPIRDLLNAVSTLSIQVLFSIYGGFDWTVDKSSDDDTVKQEKLKWYSFLASYVIDELSTYGTRAQQAFNNSFQVDARLRPLAGANNTDSLDFVSRTSSEADETYWSSSRSRSFIHYPLCFIVFYVSTVLAYNSDIRQKINFRASGCSVPIFFQEKLRMVRHSDCGSFRVITALIGLIPDEYLAALDYKDTILDVKWLTSDSGIDWTFNFFAKLQNSNSNYVRMTNFTPVILDSGAMTTFCAISLSAVTTFRSTVNGLARLLPNNGYGLNINMVHIVDSFCTGQQLFVSGNRLELQGLSFRYEDSTSYDSKPVYIRERVAGLFRNTPPPTPQPSKDAAKPIPQASPPLDDQNLIVMTANRFKRDRTSVNMSGNMFLTIVDMLNRFQKVSKGKLIQNGRSLEFQYSLN